MTDGEAILAGVLAQPEDMTPRLVYADWLDEQGEGARAELIRCQLHLAELGGYGACRDPRRGEATVGCGECELCVFCRRHDELLRWDTFWGWFGPLVTAGGVWPGSPAVSIRPDGLCEVGYFGLKRPECRWLLSVSRGFVEGVSCPLADWLGYSAHWWAMTPLRVYRPLATAVSPRDEIVSRGTALWQDERVGRLDTLDLSGLCRFGHPSDLGRLEDRARFAFRPWRGLRRLVLPHEPLPYEAERTVKRWRRHLPDVRIDFAPPPEEPQP